MNFFGHAAIAASHLLTQESTPASLVLAEFCAGAMLPDFVGMLGLSRPEVRGQSLQRGVQFHHQTDGIFHELPSFQRLSRAAFAWLSVRQLPRGPARAVAHVGIEMLLDEVMAEDAAARDAYVTALGVRLNEGLHFAHDGETERLAKLQQALLERSSTQRDLPAELVASRIRRTLAGRPRLATDATGEALLAEWVAVARPAVAAEAPELLASLRSQLANCERSK